MKKLSAYLSILILMAITYTDTIYATITLSEAVDDDTQNDFLLSTGGDSSWFGQTVVSFYDGDAAQSGTITDGQSTWIEAEVTGGAMLSFFWKISSESDCDFLIFYIDDVEMDRISGEIDWQKKEYLLSTGPHCLRWVYSKNNEVSSGLDAGWIDMLIRSVSTLEALITGTVRNSVSMQPIVGALIALDLVGGRSTYSDVDGQYWLWVPVSFSSNSYPIKASAAGYYDQWAEVNANSFEDTLLDFGMEPLAVSLTDEDQDIIPDASDNCPNNYNPQQLDADHDGIGDVCDSTPGCGSGCGQVACETPYPTTTTTSVQVTTSIITTSSSSTSTTTSVPVDTDHDGIPDVSDNCPSNCNQYQLDADRDGIGDVCDSTPGCGGCGAPNCEVQCSL